MISTSLQKPLETAVCMPAYRPQAEPPLAPRITIGQSRGAMSLSFQDLILTLHHYWSDKGCVILQPYDMEMGAGTFHPATVLRSLGPEPWRAAYVQPCRRPADGRYGENPNRLGHYYQYQVVLKPSPDDLQNLYLGSLAEIGIDPLKHDIRFVERKSTRLNSSHPSISYAVFCLKKKKIKKKLQQLKHVK